MNDDARPSSSPARPLLVVVLAILLGDALVINVLPRVGLHGWEPIVGAALLVALVSPILYVWVFRPLRRAKAELEAKVSERTAELSKANQMLASWVAQIEERSRQIMLVSEMVEQLQAAPNVAEMTALIARTIDQLCRGEAWAIYLCEPSTGRLEARGVAGSQAPVERDFAPEECLALKRAQPHFVQDPKAGPVCPHLKRAPAGPYVCAPMVAQGETLGVLHLVHPGEGGLDEARRLLVVVVAEHVGLALANFRLREQLRAQAIRDPLTGLFNRRYMEESLEREVRRANRRSASLGIVMADIDHFKKFNDTHGHDAGDALLREVGAFLRSHVRGEDIACRYGGEEFTLILPESDSEDLVKRAEELREGVRQIRVPFAEKSLGPITMSFGVAVYPEHGSTAEVVLKAADQALYRAKSGGRNRVALVGVAGKAV